MRSGRNLVIGLIAVLGVTALAGWAWIAIRPGTTTVVPVVVESAMVETTGYGIYGWEQGLQVVVVYEGLRAAPVCTPDPADGAPTEAYRCQVQFVNGMAARWSIATGNGKTGILRVDSTTTYTLPREANVLHIRAEGDSLRMLVYARELPLLTRGDASRTLEAWMPTDPDLAGVAQVFATER